VSLKVDISPERQQSLAIIKLYEGTLDLRPVSEQVQIISLGGTSELKHTSNLLYQFVKLGFTQILREIIQVFNFIVNSARFEHSLVFVRVRRMKMKMLSNC